jgi:hypothetical protein
MDFVPESLGNITKKFSQYSGFPDRDSNRAPPQYESRAILVDHPVRQLLRQTVLACLQDETVTKH